jgi:cytochrome c oxidase accessory protein FixG
VIDSISGATLNKYQLDNAANITQKRLPRNAKVDHKAVGLGDCIDCSWCVQVCPVDIDIRDGLQADCINCGLCVDACDSIMDRMHYPRGLIRFTSQEALENPHRTQETSRLPSPRFMAYGLILLLSMGLFTTQLVNRTPLNMSVLRDRGVNLYRERSGNIENVYLLRIGNMSREAQHYQLSVLPPYRLKGRQQIWLEEGEVFNVPVRAMLPKTKVVQAQQEIIFTVQSLTHSNIHVNKTTSFIAPSP